MDLTPLALSEVPGRVRLTELLGTCVTAQVSDLHLVPGEPPLARIAGQLLPLPEQGKLSRLEMFDLTQALLEGHDVTRLEAIGDFDGALSAAGGRFR